MRVKEAGSPLIKVVYVPLELVTMPDKCYAYATIRLCVIKHGG